MLFFPLTNPVDQQTMNWLIVVVGGVVFLCGLNWIFSGRYNFKGPKREMAMYVAAEAEAVHAHAPVDVKVEMSDHVVIASSSDNLVQKSHIS